MPLISHGYYVVDTMDLPIEILLLIAAHADLNSVIVMAQTCKLWRQMLIDYDRALFSFKGAIDTEILKEKTPMPKLLGSCFNVAYTEYLAKNTFERLDVRLSDECHAKWTAELVPKELYARAPSTLHYLVATSSGDAKRLVVETPWGSLWQEGTQLLALDNDGEQLHMVGDYDTKWIHGANCKYTRGDLLVLELNGELIWRQFSPAGDTLAAPKTTKYDLRPPPHSYLPSSEIGHRVVLFTATHLVYSDHNGAVHACSYTTLGESGLKGRQILDIESYTHCFDSFCYSGPYQSMLTSRYVLFEADCVLGYCDFMAMICLDLWTGKVKMFGNTMEQSFFGTDISEFRDQAVVENGVESA